MTGVLAGPSVGEDVEMGEAVEVVAKATRRRFSPTYKRRVLHEAARCTKPGELGALLRREGLYSSHLAAWRAAQARGELAGGTGRRRRLRCDGLLRRAAVVAVLGVVENLLLAVVALHFQSP